MIWFSGDTERPFIIMTSPFLKDRNRIFENAVGFVIYDKFPVNEGHCLIIPKREYADYFESTKEEIEGLNELLFQTKDFIKKKYNPDGFNVGINSGKDAGQTIFHMHIHLIPRYKNDVDNPRGGVRGVIPSKKEYSSKHQASIEYKLKISKLSYIKKILINLCKH